MQSLIEERFIKLNYSNKNQPITKTFNVNINDMIVQLDTVTIKRYNREFKKKLEISFKKYSDIEYIPNNEDTRKKKIIERLRKKIKQ